MERKQQRINRERELNRLPRKEVVKVAAQYARVMSFSATKQELIGLILDAELPIRK